MKPTLAMGVTWDFVNAASKSSRISTVAVSPVFFVCCLLTRVPRQRETTTRIGVSNSPTWCGSGSFSSFR